MVGTQRSWRCPYRLGVLYFESGGDPTIKSKVMFNQAGSTRGVLFKSVYCFVKGNQDPLFRPLKCFSRFQLGATRPNFLQFGRHLTEIIWAHTMPLSHPGWYSVQSKSMLGHIPRSAFLLPIVCNMPEPLGGGGRKS